MTDLDTAQVLEDAADILLVRGRAIGDAVDDEGRYCVVAAITDACRSKNVMDHTGALRSWLRDHEVPAALLGKSVYCPVEWNDNTADDFEVIDTLRHVAKDIRNGELG